MLGAGHAMLAALPHNGKPSVGRPPDEPAREPGPPGLTLILLTPGWLASVKVVPLRTYVTFAASPARFLVRGR
jgi:hypothetical protein